MKKKKEKEIMRKRNVGKELVVTDKNSYVLNKVIMNYLLKLNEFFEEDKKVEYFFIDKERLNLDKLEELKLNYYEDIYKNYDFKITLIIYKFRGLIDKNKIYKLKILLHKNIKLYKKNFYKYKNLYLLIHKKKYVLSENENMYIYKKVIKKLYLKLLKCEGILKNYKDELLKGENNFIKFNDGELKIIKDISKYSKKYYKNLIKKIWIKSRYPKINKKKKNKRKFIKLEDNSTYVYLFIDKTRWRLNKLAANFPFKYYEKKYQDLNVNIFEIMNNFKYLNKKKYNKNKIYKLGILLNKNRRWYKKYFYKYNNILLFIIKKYYVLWKKKNIYIYKKNRKKIIKNSKKYYKKLIKKILKKNKYKKKKNFLILEDEESYDFFCTFVENEDWWMIRGWLEENKKKFIKYNKKLTLYGYFFEFFYKGLYYYIKEVNENNNVNS